MNTSTLFRRVLLLTASLSAALCGCQRQLNEPQADSKLAAELHAAMISGIGKTGGAAVATQQKRDGWATLKGTISVIGAAPTPPPLPITKDSEVCQPGGRPVMNPVITVGPGGGLANAVLLAQGLAGDNVNASAVPGKGDEVPFDQKTCHFLNHVKTMRAGDKLKVMNSDTIAHNTQIKGSKNPGFNQMIGAGQSLLYLAAKPERDPMDVSCSIHPWMKAYVLPHENGYAVVTNPDGTFEIPNLPSGIDVTLQVWHEACQKFDSADVKFNGQSAKIANRKLTVHLKKDEANTLDIKIPADMLKP